MSIIKSIKRIESSKGIIETKEMINEISKDILQNYSIKLNGEIWEFVEIEFYYYSESHKDIYAHEHSINKLPIFKTGQFRIHGAGIDIAISNIENKAYGGILLRTIKKENGDRIKGPINVCEAIIQNMGDVEGASISLVHRKNENNVNVYKAPRVGLKLKNDNSVIEEHLKFLVEDYRFITDLEIENEKYLIALSNSNMNLDKSTVLNYKISYNEGQSINHFEELKSKVSFDFTKLHNKAKLMGYFNKSNNS